MRCHLSGEDIKSNSIPPDINHWNSPPSLLTNSLKPTTSLNDAVAEIPMEQLSSTLCTLDSAHQSQNKRKMVDSERDDIEERFWKVQRKKELRRVTARASLVVDDYDDELDEEDQIYEQMDWLEKENDEMDDECDEISSDDDLPCVSAKENDSAISIPKGKWKEERRRLLKISMAKIRGVEDPEAYLRRSVLINNTVKRLQKDVAINYRCHSMASSSFLNLHGNLSGCATFQNESIDSWEFEDSATGVFCKRQVHSESSIGFECTSLMNTDSGMHFDTSEAHVEASYNSLNFHLSFASSLSSAKPLDVLQQEMLHTTSPSLFSKSCTDDKKLADPSSSTRTLKASSSSVHVYPSQPCGLQYRNPIYTEDASSEYADSTSSTSLLDSVVYHSLIASLES